jgi:glycosyltransferase involved in cell wall biosynthesis
MINPSNIAYSVYLLLQRAVVGAENIRQQSITGKRHMQVTYQDEDLDLEARKISGREHLKANRIEDAMAVFAGILRDYPDDAESLSALGDLFLDSGNSSTAAQLYKRVIQQKKGGAEIEQRLQLALSENVQAHNDLTDLIPAHPSPRTANYQHKRPDNAAPKKPSHAMDTFSGNVLVLTNTPETPPARILLLAEGITALGGSAALAAAYPDTTRFRPDVVIASNPYLNPDLMAGLAASAAAHLPILVDLTIDAQQIPANHPDYENYGLGDADAAHAYSTMLRLARMITVHSQPLLSTLQNKDRTVRLIPEGWSKSNSHWMTQPSRTTKFNLGWIGNPGHYEDIADIRRVIIRILREYPDTHLVIAGDQTVYCMFEDVPRSKRQFFPLPPAAEFPQLLSQVDLLIKPLRDTPYNRTLSDQLLVAAGVNGIPWAASPMPAVINWGKGGVIVPDRGDWHNTLSAFMMNQELRERLGLEGQERAQHREISHIKIAWLNAINHVLSNHSHNNQ